MSTLDKVRVVVVGDSESGKTSLSHLIAHGNACERPMSTIGCSTQVKLHDYRAGRGWDFLYLINNSRLFSFYCCYGIALSLHV